MGKDSINPHVTKARSKSDFDLLNDMGYVDGSEVKSAAVAELERRKFWRNFFTHGIAAWIALIISGISLYMSIFID